MLDMIKVGLFFIFMALALGARGQSFDRINFYTHLHQNPELSFQEENTSRLLAETWREAGFDVTQNVGGFGVVGMLRNGPGPTVMIRMDMDGLLVKEQTGLPYASEARAIEQTGQAVDVMHACGHDIHMTVGTETALMLAKAAKIGAVR